MLNITGCKKEEGSNISVMSIDGITMEIKNDTLTSTGLTLIIKDTTTERYIFGDNFYIERKEENDWKKVNAIHKDYGFDDIAYYADTKDLELNQNWDYIYGKLSNGSYRLVKSTFKDSDKPILDEDIQYIYVEFDIK